MFLQKEQAVGWCEDVKYRVLKMIILTMYDDKKAVDLTVTPCIREVLSSKLIQDTGYPN
jgi:hypothetical protein